MRLALILCVLVLICSVKARFFPDFFYGTPDKPHKPYCSEKREDHPEGQPLYCDSRDDDCYRHIGYDDEHTSRCYCDIFCCKAKDCCPQHNPTPCPGDTETKECRNIGEKKGCNTCKLTYIAHKGKYEGRYETDTCINDQTMINDININNQDYGWTATAHSQFQGKKLKDGMRSYLGTTPGGIRGLNQLSITQRTSHFIHHEYEFDARKEWKGLIQSPLDQGVCGASWAYSAAGVAADRINIRSKKKDYTGEYGAKQLLSCINPGNYGSHCRTRRVVDAWRYLQSSGLVNDTCYKPYTSSFGYNVGKCEDFILCPDGKSPRREIFTPLYRIANNESAIQRDILEQGPVQATMKVRADFFLYEGGVYSHSGISDPLNTEAYHSVRIIGWGVENGVGYWLVANSWGTRWGEGGLFKIRRGVNESEIESFVVGGCAQPPIYRNQDFCQDC